MKHLSKLPRTSEERTISAAFRRSVKHSNHMFLYMWPVFSTTAVNGCFADAPCPPVLQRMEATERSADPVRHTNVQQQLYQRLVKVEIQPRKLPGASLTRDFILMHVGQQKLCFWPWG